MSNPKDAGPNTIDWKALANKWPSTVLARSKVPEFTGGLLSARPLANLDTMGEGPPVYRWKDRKVFYQVSDFIDWMKGQVSSFNGK